MAHPGLACQDPVTERFEIRAVVAVEVELYRVDRPTESILEGTVERREDVVSALERELVDEVDRVLVVVDRTAHRDCLADATLAFGVCKWELRAEIRRVHATADVDADDIRDDALGEGHREPDRSTGTPVGVGHDPDGLGERRMVDEFLDLFQAVVLDE